MKTILAITGIRSEYDIMSSVFNAINDHPNLELKIVVTGAHLSHAFGMTLHEIEKDGFQIVDKIEALPVPFYTEWWMAIINAAPLDVFAICSIVFLLLTVIAALFFLRTPNPRIKRFAFFLALVFVGVSGFSYLFARVQYQENYISNDAIIVSNRVTIYSAPNTTSTTLFIVHDGLKVSILQAENKWNKIMLPDGSVGWIPQEALVVI